VRVYIPKGYVGGKIFDSHFAAISVPGLPARTTMRNLSFRALVQNIDHVSGFQAGVHTLRVAPRPLCCGRLAG